MKVTYLLYEKSSMHVFHAKLDSILAPHILNCIILCDLTCW